MSTTQIISTGPVKSQEAQKCPTADSKTGGAGNTADPAFGLMLGQLLASVIQNGQQAPPDSTKAGDGADSGGKPAEQPQAPNLPQQPADVSKVFLGLSKQDAKADPENTLAAEFSELLKNIKGNADKTDLAPKSSRETKGPSTDKSAQPANSDPADKNVFYLSDKFGKSNSLLTADAAGPDKQGEAGDDKGQKPGPATPALPKTDFATMVQQGQNPSSNDAAAKAADAGPSPVVARPHNFDTADAFDHAVSITKDGNRLAVQLDHGGLGKLDINLSLDKGAVNAQINVADDATKKLIENNMQQIVNSLLGDGVSVGGFSVSLKQQGTWNGTPYRRDEAREKSGPFVQAVSIPGVAAAQGLVNIFI